MADLRETLTDADLRVIYTEPKVNLNPTNLSLVHQGWKTQRMVIEAPPARHLFSFLTSFVSATEPWRSTAILEENPPYYLTFPWMYYYCIFTTGKMGKAGGGYQMATEVHFCAAFGRPTPLVDVEVDELYFLPLPNFYPGSFSFCNNNYRLRYRPEDPLSEAIEGFWSSPFTYTVPGSKGAAAIWARAAELAAGAGFTPARPPVGYVDKYESFFHRGATSVRPVWEYWETLSLDQVLAFPFGSWAVGPMDRHTQFQTGYQ